MKDERSVAIQELLIKTKEYNKILQILKIVDKPDIRFSLHYLSENQDYTSEVDNFIGILQTKVNILAHEIRELSDKLY